MAEKRMTNHQCKLTTLLAVIFSAATFMVLASTSASAANVDDALKASANKTAAAKTSQQRIDGISDQTSD